MASKSTKFSVGIFVIIGIMIIVSAVMYFGLYGVFEKGRYCVAYFDESVQGLTTDSDVKYRGVRVGRVESISVAKDNTLIKVVLNLEKNIDLNRDIVAQLTSVGITGMVFIELDVKDPDAPDVSPEITFEPEYPVIATKPSDLKKYMESADMVLSKFKALDVQGISDRAISTLDNINSTMDSLHLDRISEDIRMTFNNMEKILNPQQWQKLVGSFQASGKSMHKLIDNVDKTVSDLDQTILRVDGIVKNSEEDLSIALKNFTQSLDEASLFLSQGSDLIDNTDKTIQNLHYHLVETLQNVEEASRHLNRSMEKIAEQPSALIFSTPALETKK